MGRIKDYFIEQGLGPKDIPVAFVFHEVISVAFAASTVGETLATNSFKRVAGSSRVAHALAAERDSRTRSRTLSTHFSTYALHLSGP